MYEIWLMLNIVWEIALDTIGPIIMLALVWLTLIVLAARNQQSNWRGTRVLAIVVGGAFALAAMFALPALTRSSTSELAYIVDWLALFGMAVGFGAAAAVFSWPALALLRKHSDSPAGRLQGGAA